VSAHNFKRKRKTKIKSVVSTILVFLFAIISSSILISEKKKLKAYDERIFYFVSVANSKKISLLDDKKELLKNLGGASVVFSRKDVFYLFANVYLEQESALEIKSNLVKYFPDTEIIKIKIERISNKGIKNIKNIVGAEEVIKFLYKLSNDYQYYQMNFLMGALSDGKFLSFMLEKKMTLEKLLADMEKTTELGKKISSYVELMLFQLNNFLNGFTIAKHVQHYVCNYFVGFYLNYDELFDCL
jgi:hypothetical protein